MRRFTPNLPFNVPMKLLVPTWSVVKGVHVPTYPDPDDGILFYCSFKTYGGSENYMNNIYTVFDTATIETWYRPEFDSNCRIYDIKSGKTYEIKASPENIDNRNQYLLMKVESIGGRA